VIVRTFTKPREPPRPPRTDSRERVSPDCDPGCLPSDENLCPATSFRTPGSGPFRLRGFATAAPVIDAVDPPVCPLRSLPGSLVPVHAPACHRDRVSLNLSVVRRLLQPMSTREHTLRAVAPRTRVRLSPRYSLAPTDASCVGPLHALPRGKPASRALHAPAFARCVPLAWTRQSARAEALERRLERALLTRSCVPSSLHSGHPSHRFDSSSGLENLGTRRTGRDPSWMQPRERLHRRESRGAFCRAGILTRAEDCSSVRAWTVPPSLDLRGGVARGDTRLCCPLEAPSSDEDGASIGLDPLYQGSRSPGGTTSRSARHGYLRPNQLAG